MRAIWRASRGRLAERAAPPQHRPIPATPSSLPGPGTFSIHPRSKLMNSHERVRRVAIVGTGTIGASWATHYLAHGFDVVATDPAPGSESALRNYVHEAWDAAATLC